MFSGTSFKSTSFHPISWKGIGVSPPTEPPNNVGGVIGGGRRSRKSTRRAQIINNRAAPEKVYSYAELSFSGIAEFKASIELEVHAVPTYTAAIQLDFTGKSISAVHCKYLEMVSASIDLQPSSEFMVNLVGTKDVVTKHKELKAPTAREEADVLNMLALYI